MAGLKGLAPGSPSRPISWEARHSPPAKAEVAIEGTGVFPLASPHIVSPSKWKEITKQKRASLMPPTKNKQKMKGCTSNMSQKQQMTPNCTASCPQTCTEPKKRCRRLGRRVDESLRFWVRVGRTHGPNVTKPRRQVNNLAECQIFLLFQINLLYISEGLLCFIMRY